MDVKLKVTVQIDTDDRIDGAEITDDERNAMREAAKNAIHEAISFKENVGFEHELSHVASIGLVDVEII